MRKTRAVRPRISYSFRCPVGRIASESGRAKRQVMPSFISDLEVAKAWDTNEDEREAQNSWEAKARHFIRKRRMDETEDKQKKPPKKQRKGQRLGLCASTPS